MIRVENLKKLVEPFYTHEDPAHDWPHIQRVITNAKMIADGEPVNLPCLLAAVYCHDLVNLPKNHPDRSKASELAAEKAKPLLLESGFSLQECIKIQQAIIEHSFSKGLRPTTLEAAIVQDADRLDTLGAIGILRCASVNTQMKTSFYHQSDPLAKDRELDDKKFMLDHYFVKLFQIPALMNTQRAKQEAEKRMSFMKEFLKTLLEETRN